MKLKEEIKHDKIKDENINTLIITKERKENIYIYSKEKQSLLHYSYFNESHKINHFIHTYLLKNMEIKRIKLQQFRYLIIYNPTKIIKLGVFFFDSKITRTYRLYGKKRL